MNHTPGPWFEGPFTDREGYVSRSRWITDAEQENCRIPRGSASIAVVYSSCTRERTSANAALIAAAPELLEALEAITLKAGQMDLWQHAGGVIPPRDWSDLYELHNKARAVIRKARGE